MKIRIVNPLDFQGWDELLLLRSDSSFFQSESWAKILHHTFGYIPLYFSVFDKNGFSALIPIMEVNSLLTGRRGVSLPFTPICEHLLDSNIQFDEIIDDIFQYGKKSRWKTFVMNGDNCYLEKQTKAYEFYTHSLDLT